MHRETGGPETLSGVDGVAVMNCPGPCTRSFRVCVRCGACDPHLQDICPPGLLARTQQILEHKFEPAYVPAVMA